MVNLNKWPSRVQDEVAELVNLYGGRAWDTVNDGAQLAAMSLTDHVNGEAELDGAVMASMSQMVQIQLAAVIAQIEIKADISRADATKVAIEVLTDQGLPAKVEMMHRAIQAAYEARDAKAKASAAAGR